MSLLSHLKVVDLTEGLGAYTGRLLAELGAEVIKIEPLGGDTERRTGPFLLRQGFGGQVAAGAADGLAWLALNAGKRGVELDLAAEAGQAAAAKLIAAADILVVGPDRRGLPAYEALADGHAGLIEVALLPFAEHGVHAGKIASDLTLMALSGLMTIVGDPDRPPLKLPGEQAFALSGIQGVTAALLAVHARRASGHGQRAVVSAYQSAILANYREPVSWAWTGKIGRRTGNQLVRGKSGVRQVWPCKDGYVTWALVDNPGMVKGMIGFMQAEGRGDLLAAVDWDNILVANADQGDIAAWEAELEAFFALHTKEELFAMSNQAGLGLSRIDDLDDALSGEQETVRGFWSRVDDQARGLAYQLPGRMFLASASPPQPLRPAPALGEANAELIT